MCKFCAKISFPKLFLILIILFSFGTAFGVIGYLLIQQLNCRNNFNCWSAERGGTPIKKEISKIEISTDAKSILGTDAKEIIFTIEDTKKYLKDSGYEYNPDTFQTINAKYEGDCFLDAALSNNNDRIVFSTGCLPGDLPQAWIGVYDFNYACRVMPECEVGNLPFLGFLIPGSGRNFVWSEDDKTITYEADLGLSGITETRTIDSNTGETLETRSKSEIDTSDWKIYRNEKYEYEVMYPAKWKGGEESSTTEIASFTLERRDMAQTGFWIYVYGNPKNLAPKEWWKEYKKGSASYLYKGSFQIFGINAEVYKEQGGSEFTYYLLSKNSLIYLISSPIVDEKMHKILLTFQFIEKGKVYQAPTLEQLLNTTFTFKEIFSKIIEGNPGLSLERFSMIGSFSIGARYGYNSFYKGSLYGSKINPPQETDPHWVFSPDKTKAVNPTFFTEDVDVDLWIYNRINDGMEERLQSCGTPCDYWGALWLNNEQFIFINSTEDSNSCVEDENRITSCKRVVSISLFDLKNNMETVYDSISLEGIKRPRVADWDKRRQEICKRFNQSCDFLENVN